MNYILYIAGSGVRALKLKAVEGAMTNANSGLTAGEEYIATCNEGATSINFEPEAGNVPASGVPTGNYQVYKSETIEDPVWDLIEGMGLISIANNDLGTILDGKAAADHNHNSVYATIGHNHNSVYATITSVTALSDDVTALENSLLALITDISSGYSLTAGAFQSSSKVKVYAQRPNVTIGGEEIPLLGLFNFQWVLNNIADWTANWEGISQTLYQGEISSYSNEVWITKPPEGDSIYNKPVYLHFRVKLSNAVSQTGWTEFLNFGEINEPHDVTVENLAAAMLENTDLMEDLANRVAYRL
jgi:hypothetical protein